MWTIDGFKYIYMFQLKSTLSSYCITANHIQIHLYVSVKVKKQSVSVGIS